MTDIEMLCFDVIGDFVDPKTVDVDEAEGTVTVHGCPRHLIPMVKDEWDANSDSIGGKAYRLVFAP